MDRCTLGIRKVSQCKLKLKYGLGLGKEFHKCNFRVLLGGGTGTGSETPHSYIYLECYLKNAYRAYGTIYFCFILGFIDFYKISTDLVESSRLSLGKGFT